MAARYLEVARIITGGEFTKLTLDATALSAIANNEAVVMKSSLWFYKPL